MNDPRMPNMDMPRRTIIGHDSPPPPSGRELNIVKRGEAIAHVRHLEETVERLTAEVAATLRKLERTEDRLTIVVEERTRWRRDAEAYRTALIELSSDMRNIGLLTANAADTHRRVIALIEAETPPEEDHNTLGGTPLAANEFAQAISDLTASAPEASETDPPPLFLQKGAPTPPTDARDGGLAPRHDPPR